MNSPVQKIKERLSITEIVSSYIKLERAGANLKAKCPFHNEKTPSFFVSPDRGNYYCFGCGASGDIFTFVEEFEGLDFKGALKILADKAGVTLSDYIKENKGAESEKERLYQVMEEAVKFFENNLRGNSEVLKYLKSRGLLDKTIQDFRIGFANNEWRHLYNYLKSKDLPAGRQDFTDLELEKAGLVKKTDKGFYDRFRGRIMFPLADSSGRIIAFSGRLFPESAPTPSGVGTPTSQNTIVGAKYLNSPDTPIFKKSAILYGLDKAKQSIRKNNFSIVVEGQFDLILSHQAGFKNTVATSGTSLTGSDRSDNDTTNNLGMISHLSENIIFVFDGDKAGLAASERATPIGLALFNDMNVKAASMPPGVDPADLISREGVDAWRAVIRGAKHIIEFLVDRYVTDIDNKDPLKIKLTIEKKIIPYLQLIQNPIKKSHFISMIAHKSGVREEDIREILEKNSIPDLGQGNVILENKSKVLRKDYILRKLLGIILWQKTLTEKHLDIDHTLKEISEILNITVEEVLERAQDSHSDLIFEAEIFYGGGADVVKDTQELLLNLKEEYLKEELEQKMRELHEVEEAKDTELATNILKECQIINNKIQNIKNEKEKQKNK